MKKNLFFVLCACFALVFTACKQEGVMPPPTGDFTWSPVVATHTDRSPLKVLVQARGAIGATYHWEASGTVENATAQSTHITFGSSGEHFIKITVRENGQSTTTRQTFVLKPAMQASVSSITLNAFPATNNGASWDSFLSPNDRADVFSEVRQGTASLAIGGVSNNALPTVSIGWQFPTALTVLQTLPVNVYFWDDDSSTGGSAQYIGGLQFTPSTLQSVQVDATRYPSTITYNQNGMSATVALTWR